MKPTVESVRNLSRGDALPSARRVFPVTNCNYQSVALDGYRGDCARTVAPSFRNISSDYFETEAGREFAGEATLFAMIVLTVAVPLLHNLQAITDFVRAISGI
jgi:hypothetical protein